MQKIIVKVFVVFLLLLCNFHKYTRIILLEVVTGTALLLSSPPGSGKEEHQHGIEFQTAGEHVKDQNKF